ncbi:helix-turn-helix domain-containing protein [Primorskyibacter sp. S87]|uniref:helix-turn-helix domain-containing protein n=1 Tax=Primorskyibacter sp. S87 TaxID=3415126 RepID=UPI003C7AF423
MPNLPFSDKAEYLSVRQISELFGYHTKTVRRWIASGDLPATKIGRDWRVARSDLKTLAASRSNRVAGHVL